MTTPSIPQNPTTVDVLLTLMRLETKMDGYAVQATDHESRLRVLEARRWPIASVGIIISLAAAGLSGAALLAN